MVRQELRNKLQVISPAKYTFCRLFWDLCVEDKSIFGSQNIAYET